MLHIGYLLGYLNARSGFEAAKTAPWSSRGLHNFGKFLEPSDEWAGRGCYCFLVIPWALRWVSWSRMLLLPDAVTLLGIFGWSGMSSRITSSSNLNFSVLTLSMSLGYFGNELHNRGPNAVTAFSWRDCAGFLFVGYWITHCVPCLGCFLVFIVCPLCHQYLAPFALLSS